MIDKGKIKNNLQIEQIRDLLNELCAEPILKGDMIVCKTICHNHIGEGSHKLYYYDNTKLFKCYTGCNNSTFDIFELIIKVIKNQKEKELTLGQAINFVLKYFGLNYVDNDFFNNRNKLEDWKIFEKHERQKEENEKRIIEFKHYDKDILKYYPQYRVESWENDGITFDVMKSFNIHYCPEHHSILIPHYDIDDNLIGIRERTMIKEDAEKYGKYHPVNLNGKLYNHATGLSLYGLNKTKENIKTIGKVIVAEGEKSSLQYASYFGIDNNICVACCGSNITSYQIDLLLSLGVKEIIVAFDKQFQIIGDDEWKKLTDNLTTIYNKYGKFTQISYLFDKEDILSYKASPFDRGKEIFLEMFERRVTL